MESASVSNICVSLLLTHSSSACRDVSSWLIVYARWFGDKAHTLRVDFTASSKRYQV